jgi:hypothetical protein
MGGVKGGGSGSAGAGGDITFTTGTGGAHSSVGYGGAGGGLVLTGGTGGTSATGNGGVGATITLNPGAGGWGGNMNGADGNIVLASLRGNVGIGTASPSQNLHIFKNNGTTAGMVYPVRIDSTTSATGNLNGTGLEFYWGTRSSGAIETLRTNAAGDYGTALIFKNNAPGSSSGTTAGLSERMRIDASGFVGIGTTTPGAMLHIGTADPSINNDGRIISASGTGSGGARAYSFGSNNTYNNNFTISDTATATPLLVINGTRTGGASGNVGIGITNPGYKLTVNGQPAANGYTAFTNYSDSRLKTNINSLSSGYLEKILKLNPSTFNYNGLTGYDQATLDRKVTGFIAQDLGVTFPEMVGKTVINGIQYLDTNLSALPVYLVKAIQEQQIRIDEISLSTVSAEITKSEWNNIQAMIDVVNSSINKIQSKLTAMTDEFFTKKSHQEELCIGKAGDETCLTKGQIDRMISNLAVPTATPSASPVVPTSLVTPVPTESPVLIISPTPLATESGSI